MENDKKPTTPPLGTAPVEKKSKRGCIIAAIVCGAVAVLAVPVIGILAGLLFPATSGVLREAKKAHAENDAYNLRNGIAAYFTEYRKYPVRNPVGDATVRTEDELMPTLFGFDSESGASGLNPRRIAFFTGKQAKPTEVGGWRKGVNLDEENPGLYDPWGNPYWVSIDSDYDNKLENPDGSGELNESIAVWSAGPDGDPKTWEDNIRTW